MTPPVHHPRVFDILDGQASDTRDTPYGVVGMVHSDEGIEAVWVRKQDEAVDPEWFSQQMVDLILLLQGQLRVEFVDPKLPDLTMQPGQVLVLPAGIECRAYRWPRDAVQPTIFFAAYPKSGDRRHE
ncbi:MAG TPA: hypothetical protein VKX16_16365 [Chloroflexota bacterium]|nr:hypothetical protein [Chloroflexota bacterium]